MAKILLIHGYGIGRRAPYFLQPLHTDGGFAVFSDLFAGNEATVFYWDTLKEYTLAEFLNPFSIAPLYIYERKIAESRTTLEKLYQKITQEQPETILCHSLGCYLLLNYLHTYSLPTSIKKIIFVQGDVSTTKLTQDNTVKTILRETSIMVTNIYCPWDTTLCASMLFNRYIPIGIRPIPLKGVQNILFPAFFPNPHTYSIRNNKRLLTVL